jgi:chemotaxis response regulator CheB
MHTDSPLNAPHENDLPPVAPDFIGQDSSEDLDNIIPTRGYQMTPMVGLGGSAGSIQALTEFFKVMPPDSGMVFVVILHLSPTHESTLADLLGNTTFLRRSTNKAHPWGTDGLCGRANSSRGGVG